MSTNPPDYVVGFLFDSFQTRNVILIEKIKPDWQRGKLNGVGGKIEKGETSHQAMTREFEEEAGIRVDAWVAFAALYIPGGTIYAFAATKSSFAGIHSVTAEKVGMYNADKLPTNVVPNLRWLVPLALNVLEDPQGSPRSIIVNYRMPLM